MQATVKRNEYWSTATPYHYLRFEDHPTEGLCLVVGGGDHQVLPTTHSAIMVCNLQITFPVKVTLDL
jgi:hypothetical protein